MKKLETINIKGKKYATVSTRVKHLREDYKDLKMDVNIVATDNDHQGVWIKASIYEKGAKKDDIPIAAGIAYEQKSGSGVNSTNWTENCDTSAVGRALANLGIGIEDAYASANEMELALEKEIQNKKAKSKPDAVNKNTTPAKDREVYEDTVRTSGTELEDGGEQKLGSNMDIDGNVGVGTTSPAKEVEPEAETVAEASQDWKDQMTGKKKAPAPPQTATSEEAEDVNETEEEYLVEFNRRVSTLKNSADAKALADEGREWSSNWTYKKDTYKTMYACISESFAAFKRSEDNAESANLKGGA